MASADTLDSGTTGVGIALILFVIIYVAVPFVIPGSSDSSLLGLPNWYWITLVMGAIMWLFFYFIAQNIDQVYELAGVR